MEYNVVLRRMPETDVFFRRGEMESYDGIKDFVESSIKLCSEHFPDAVLTEGGCRCISFTERPETGKPIKVEFFHAATGGKGGSADAGFRTLRSTDVACVRYKGPYDEMGDAYASLVRWLFSNGHRASEPPRENYIKGPWEIRNKKEWITEIQIPISIPDDMR